MDFPVLQKNSAKQKNPSRHSSVDQECLIRNSQGRRAVRGRGGEHSDCAVDIAVCLRLLRPCSVSKHHPQMNAGLTEIEELAGGKLRVIDGENAFV